MLEGLEAGFKVLGLPSLPTLQQLCLIRLSPSREPGKAVQGKSAEAEEVSGQWLAQSVLSRRQQVIYDLPKSCPYLSCCVTLGGTSPL